MSTAFTAPVADVDSASRVVTLEEYQTSDPVTLSEAAQAAIDTEINQSSTRLEIQYTAGKTVRLRATSHVGIVALPGDVVIEVRPKVTDVNVAHLLRYARGVRATTVERETHIRHGQSFIEALAALYTSELDQTLTHGLHSEYRRTTNESSHLRGRLEIQQQVQRSARPGPPTNFICTHDELTVDTTLNRAVLYATSLLTRLVRDQTLASDLQRQQRQLRRRVTLMPVRPVELERVSLNRLSEHYTDLLRLTELVLQGVHVNDLRAGSRSSFALLVDMETIFESMVERAFEDALEAFPGWRVRTQVSSTNLVDTAGNARTIRIRPDILVVDNDDSPVLVGDAKWKQNSTSSQQPTNNDIYQVLAYQRAYDTPGMLLYPEQEGKIEGQYTNSGSERHRLHLVELPLTAQEATIEYPRFCDRLREHLVRKLNPVAEAHSNRMT